MAVAAVIILSSLIILAFIALVTGGIMTMRGKGAAAPAVAFSLPRGARILTSETQPDRLILHVRTADGGEEIDIVDTGTGKLVSSIKASGP